MGSLEKGIPEIHLSIRWGLSAAAITGADSALLLSAFSSKGGHRRKTCMDSYDLWRISGSLSAADAYRIFRKEMVSSDSARGHGEVEMAYDESYGKDVFLRFKRIGKWTA